jgi:hypothetical protein
LTEVAIASCTLSRDDGNALAEEGQAQLVLEVEDALFLQQADNLLTTACHVANGVCRVNVADNP